MIIQKALSPEEQAILGNIKSLVAQLEGAGSELPIEMAKSEDGFPPKEEVVEKCDDPNAIQGQPNKVAKDETGRATAEQKLDELPVDDEEALSVLKSLLGGGSSVRKSARVDPIQVETLKVLKALSSKVQAQEQALTGILEGIGITDEVLKVEKSRTPLVSVQPSANDILKALTDAIAVQKSAQATPEQPAGDMRDVLAGMWN